MYLYIHYIYILHSVGLSFARLLPPVQQAGEHLRVAGHGLRRRRVAEALEARGLHSAGVGAVPQLDRHRHDEGHGVGHHGDGLATCSRVALQGP